MTMATYEITTEMNLKKIIAESRDGLRTSSRSIRRESDRKHSANNRKKEDINESYF